MRLIWMVKKGELLELSPNDQTCQVRELWFTQMDTRWGPCWGNHRIHTHIYIYIYIYKYGVLTPKTQISWDLWTYSWFMLAKLTHRCFFFLSKVQGVRFRWPVDYFRRYAPPFRDARVKKTYSKLARDWKGAFFMMQVYPNMMWI